MSGDEFAMKEICRCRCNVGGQDSEIATYLGVHFALRRCLSSIDEEDCRCMPQMPVQRDSVREILNSGWQIRDRRWQMRYGLLVLISTPRKGEVEAFKKDLKSRTAVT